MPSATPISHWIGFHLFLLALLGVELLFARRSAPHTTEADRHQKTQRTAIAATILWIAAALAFALFVHHTLGARSAAQYLAGYAIEEALSIDNLFVFLLLFRLFHIESSRQPRVLFWGVAGAILMRGLFIAAGLGLLSRFAWITWVFGLILLIAAVRLVMPAAETDRQGPPRWVLWLTRVHPISPRQDTFFARLDENPAARLIPTVLFLTLVAIELADVVFALDSIPAVLSITRHPFLAYTSNIMAVMGLRSLYFLLIHLLARLRFLHYGLAAVLAFAALKMLAARWIEVSPLVSLAVILALLGLTVLTSLLAPHPTPAPHE